MKPGDLVSVTVDNYDAGVGMLVEEGDGFKMCRVLMFDGKTEYYFSFELTPLSAEGNEEIP